MTHFFEDKGAPVQVVLQEVLEYERSLMRYDGQDLSSVCRDKATREPVVSWWLDLLDNGQGVWAYVWLTDEVLTAMLTGQIPLRTALVERSTRIWVDVFDHARPGLSSTREIPREVFGQYDGLPMPGVTFEKGDLA